MVPMLRNMRSTISITSAGRPLSHRELNIGHIIGDDDATVDIHA